MKDFDKAEKLFWPVFLAWSGIGLASIFLQADAEMVRRSISNGPLQAFVLSCLGWGDFIFHVLAAANLLFASALFIGWKRTWISFALVAVLSAIVETIGARTGFPFGSYFYTERMGPRLFETLPVAIPLAWWNILCSFYFLTRHALPKLQARSTCLVVASLATTLDWVMEPFAWQIQHYWIWERGSIPPQNYTGWFALSFALARLCPFYSSYRPALDKRILAVPLLMLVFFVSARLIHNV